MRSDNNQKVFFALVKAGLWEQEVRLLPFGDIDFNEIYRLAEEQTVVGLVAAGLEHVVDMKVPQGIALTFAGATLQIEQRNMAMNRFINTMMEKLDAAGVESVLIKGQGGLNAMAGIWRCGFITE